jgi:hypothetical protein
MLALEDGRRLRLLAGIGAPELLPRAPFSVRGSVTRFGAVDISLVPEGRGWRLSFQRGEGPAPAEVSLPENLGGLRFKGAKGAGGKSSGGAIAVDPGASSWSAVWG